MLRGRLEDLALADMCLLVWNARESGLMRVRTADAGGQIYFVDGRVRHAESGRVRVGYGRELIAAGALTTARLHEVVQQSATSGRQPEDLLVEGDVPRELLEAAATRAVEGALVDLLSWTRGEFDFEGGATLDGSFPCSLPGDVRRLSAAVALVRKYERALPVPSTISLEDDGAGWSPVAWHIITSADGGTTVAEMARRLNVTTLTVIEALMGLVAKGAVGVRWTGPGPRVVALEEPEPSLR